MICLTLWHLEQAKNAFREGLGKGLRLSLGMIFNPNPNIYKPLSQPVRCVSLKCFQGRVRSFHLLSFSYDIQSQP